MDAKSILYGALELSCLRRRRVLFAYLTDYRSFPPIADLRCVDFEANDSIIQNFAVLFN